MKFRTPWHLRVLYFSSFFLRLAFGALLLLIAAYAPGDLDDYEKLLYIAIIAVPYPAAEMLTANYFGILSDHRGRRPIIILGTSLAAATTLSYGLTNNMWYVAAVHGIHGIGAAATIAPAIAMIADHAALEDRGRQMGWFDYSTFLGYIGGAILGGVLIDVVSAPYGAHWSFALVAGLLLTSALLLYFGIREEGPRSGGKHYVSLTDLRTVFRSREIRLMFPIWLIIAILLGLAVTFLPRILMTAGSSGIRIGFLFAIAGVALGILQPLWGKISDRIGRLPVMFYGVLSIAGIAITITFFPDEIATFDPVTGIHFTTVGLIPLTIFGLGVGAFVPAALAMMADHSDPKAHGATMGLYSFALGFGAFIAEGIGLGLILASGSDRESAPLWILYFAGGLVALAVLLMLLFFAESFIDQLRNRRRRAQA